MKKIKFVAVLAIILVMGIKSSNAQISKFKALYIYNISRYVAWPPNYGSSEFTIGIVGDNKELLSTLGSVCSQKTVNGKKMKVVKVSSKAEANGCHVLYFLDGKDNQIASYKAVAPHSLIVTETSGATKKGSGINFYIESKKLMFELKPSNISAHGLTISNDLKSLAAKTL